MKEDPAGKIIRSWKENASKWTAAVRTQALESIRLVTDSAILRAVLSSPGSHILDVGCGEGWMAYRLADEVRTVVGFDGCPELISHGQPGQNPKFLVMSMRGSPIEPLLNAIHRVVKPSGNLLIQTVHPVAVSAGLPYENGWREETFELLPGRGARYEVTCNITSPIRLRYPSPHVLPHP